MKYISLAHLVSLSFLQPSILLIVFFHPVPSFAFLIYSMQFLSIYFLFPISTLRLSHLLYRLLHILSFSFFFFPSPLRLSHLHHFLIFSFPSFHSPLFSSSPLPLLYFPVPCALCFFLVCSFLFFPFFLFHLFSTLLLSLQK